MSEKKEELCISQSQDILDKLWLLKYDKLFVQKMSMKPIIPDYFAIPINQHEQFTYFKNLVKWLFSINELDDTEFDTYDDPNTVAQNIQHELGKLDITLEVRGNRIKQGYGKHVCEILSALIKKSLKSQRVRLGYPEFPKK